MTLELLTTDVVRLVSSCPALVLAGGLGTRLQSSYNFGPKCMAPIGGHFFLEYLLFWLRSAGIRKLIMCVGHKRSQIESWLDDGSRWGVVVTYSREESLLGTGGALKLAEHLITDDCFFVLNGDSFLDVDLAEMFCFHDGHKSLATMAVVSQPLSARYGVVEMATDQKITAFGEPSFDMQGAHGGEQVINGGVYLFERDVLNMIPADKNVSLEKEIFPSLVNAGLYGFITSGYFIDIGVPIDFERAQTELPKRFLYDHTR